jgi:hypothetical protein
MQVELKPPLDKRLTAAAAKYAISVPELVERVLTRYLDTVEDDPVLWAKANQASLARVWPAEDFSDWNPPRAR